MAPTPPSAAAITTASKNAVADGGNIKNPPIVVSPTPTPEQIGDLATALVQKRGTIYNTNRKQKIFVANKSPRNPKKENVVTVGHHDEMYVNRNTKYNGCSKTKKSSSSSIFPSASSSSSSTNPPLISRYCGCCGDILSTKAYGFDEEHRERRFRFHPGDGIRTDRERIRVAAEAVRNRVLQGLKVGGAGSSSILSSSLSTKASRKKKKADKGQDKQIHDEFLKGLSPWPEESLRMDMTILEGLLSLKNTPSDEVGCRCWQGSKTVSKESKRDHALVTGKSPSPNAKVKKTKAAKIPNSGKVKTVVKKKAAVVKGSSPVAANNPEVISSKTVIIKCPKTGKKIKKTVRIVKKLIKKKRILPKTTGGDSLSSEVYQVGSSTSSSAEMLTSPTGSLIVPSSSSPASGEKEIRGTPDQDQSKCGKKRSRDDGSVEDDDLSASDDGSDDGGSSSLKKRRRNDEKADLDLRERLMNCPLENGPLYPSHQELMELTTIRKRNALQTFYKRFNELRQFIVIFGDANVPQQFPENHSLGIWVNKMRMERKKWDTGSERTSLTERKIELLESIDFIWAQNHKGEIGWERRFQEIRKFKRKHGHCNVPTKSAENRALGRWVSTQRTMYKNYMKGFVGKSLTREEQERRIFLLLKEGFLFSMIPNGQNPGGGDSNGEEIVPSDSIVAVAPSTAVAETLMVSNPVPGSPAGKEVATGTFSSAVTETPASIESKVTNDVPKASASKETSPQSTKTDEKSSNEQFQHDPASLSARKFVESEERVDSGENRKETKTASSSPSQTTAEIAKSEAAMTSPRASRAPSIAQVSVTTTPTTTPSVSTTASPDRSPKTITSHNEPLCDTTKTASVAERTEVIEDSMKKDTLPATDTLPVASSLKTEGKPKLSATLGKETRSTLSKHLETQNAASGGGNAISIEEALAGNKTESPVVVVSRQKAETAVPSSKSYPNIDKNGNPSHENVESDRSPSILVPKHPSTEVGPLASPSTLPEKETKTLDVLISNQKPIRAIAPELSIKNSAAKEMVKPKLVTSDGLRIIVTMNDPDDETFDERSASSRKSSDADFSTMSPSPSRRSVRARKPSARQLEAETSPLRESILGR